jgi:hypothetical protein
MLSVRQTWSQLLFAHWPISADALRPLVPSCLDIDRFDGTAWLGVVPFRMSGVRITPLPTVPTAGEFLELNVRTYVVPRRGEGKPGVWFFSLDASSRLAVFGARTWFHLPYFRAGMSLQCDSEGGAVTYRCRRADPAGAPAVFEGRYRPDGPVEPAARSGSIEHWLTERYCLYAVRRQRLWRGDVEHLPWPLQRAEAEIAWNTMTALPLADSRRPALVHYAHRLDVVARPLVPMSYNTNC